MYSSTSYSGRKVDVERSVIPSTNNNNNIGTDHLPATTTVRKSQSRLSPSKAQAILEEQKEQLRNLDALLKSSGFISGDSKHNSIHDTFKFLLGPSILDIWPTSADPPEPEKVPTFIVHCLKSLGYPSTISRSDICAVGFAQSQGARIAATWSVELGNIARNEIYPNLYVKCQGREFLLKFLAQKGRKELVALHSSAARTSFASTRRISRPASPIGGAGLHSSRNTSKAPVVTETPHPVNRTGHTANIEPDLVDGRLWCSDLVGRGLNAWLSELCGSEGPSAWKQYVEFVERSESSVIPSENAQAYRTLMDEDILLLGRLSWYGDVGLREKINKGLLRLSQIKQELLKSELDRLREEINEIDRSANRMEKDVERVQELKDKVQLYDSDLEKCQQNAVSEKNHISSLLESCKNWEREVDQKTEELSRLDGEIDGLKKQVSEQGLGRNDAVMVLNQIAKCKTSISQLEDCIANTQKKMSGLNVRLNAILREIHVDLLDDVRVRAGKLCTEMSVDHDTEKGLRFAWNASGSSILEWFEGPDNFDKLLSVERLLQQETATTLEQALSSVESQLLEESLLKNLKKININRNRELAEVENLQRAKQISLNNVQTESDNIRSKDLPKLKQQLDELSKEREKTGQRRDEDLRDAEKALQDIKLEGIEAHALAKKKAEESRVHLEQLQSTYRNLLRECKQVITSSFDGSINLMTKILDVDIPNLNQYFLDSLQEHSNSSSQAVGVEGEDSQFEQPRMPEIENVAITTKTVPSDQENLNPSPPSPSSEGSKSFRDIVKNSRPGLGLSRVKTAKVRKGTTVPHA